MTTYNDIEIYYKACKPFSKRITSRKNRKDPSHITKKIKEVALQIGNQHRLSNFSLKAIEWGADLMDIGEIIIDGSIFNKETKLDENERALIHKHPQESYDILSELIPFDNSFVHLLKKVVLHHHERPDGKGPCQVLNQHICLEAKILAFATAFVVIGSQVEWRKALSDDERLEEIKRNLNKQFCPSVVFTFLKG